MYTAVRDFNVSSLKANSANEYYNHFENLFLTF